MVCGIGKRVACLPHNEVVEDHKSHEESTRCYSNMNLHDLKHPCLPISAASNTPAALFIVISRISLYSSRYNQLRKQMVVIDHQRYQSSAANSARDQSLNGSTRLFSVSPSLSPRYHTSCSSALPPLQLIYLNDTLTIHPII